MLSEKKRKPNRRVRCRRKNPLKIYHESFRLWVKWIHCYIFCNYFSLSLFASISENTARMYAFGKRESALTKKSGIISITHLRNDKETYKRELEKDRKLNYKTTDQRNTVSFVWVTRRFIDRTGTYEVYFSARLVYFFVWI